MARSAFPVTLWGHGALICALKNTEYYSSASAFAPISHPNQCAWGHKAFSRYLGEDEATWASYDSCEMLKTTQSDLPILVDQGSEDCFLKEQLKFNELEVALAGAK